MIPMQWYANVKLPYYGWFGETFSSELDARRFVAKMLKSRAARYQSNAA